MRSGPAEGVSQMCGCKSNRMKSISIALLTFVIISCGNSNVNCDYYAETVTADPEFNTVSQNYGQLPRRLSFNRDTCYITFANYSTLNSWMEEDSFTVPVKFTIENGAICIYDFYTFEKVDNQLSLKLYDQNKCKIAEVIYNAVPRAE